MPGARRREPAGICPGHFGPELEEVEDHSYDGVTSVAPPRPRQTNGVLRHPSVLSHKYVAIRRLQNAAGFGQLG